MVKTKALKGRSTISSCDAQTSQPNTSAYPHCLALAGLGLSCLSGLSNAQNSTVNNVPIEQVSIIRTLADLNSLVPAASLRGSNTILTNIQNIQRCAHSGPTADTYNLQEGGASCELNDFNRFKKIDTFVSSALERGSHTVTLREPTDTADINFDGTTLAAGFRYNFSERLAVGSSVSRYLVNSGSLSASRTEFTNAAQTDFSRNGLSIFLNYDPQKPWFFNAILEKGRYQIDGARTQPGVVAPLTPYKDDYAAISTGGDELGATVNMGIQHQIDATKLSAFANLGYSDVNINSYNERSASGDSNPFAQIEQINMQITNISIGADVSWVIEKSKSLFSPSFSVTWVQSEQDQPMTVNGRLVGKDFVNEPLRYTAPENDGSYLEASIGLLAAYRNGFSGYANISTQTARENFSSRQLSVGGRWRF